MKSIGLLLKIFFSTLLFTSLLCSYSIARAADGNFVFDARSDYWPTNEWRITPPEKQGVESATLASLFTQVNENNEPINSILIIKNGYIIAEANKNDIEDLHPLWSSTKSVSSVMVGIAQSKNIIKSVEQPLTDFFPNRTIERGPSKNSVPTLFNLLTMSSGMDWPELESSGTHPDNPLYTMHMSENWLDFILSRKLVEEPGQMFNYNSGGSHLLLGILAQSGMDVEKFAQDNLFQPLGILPSQYRWSKDPDDIPNGSHGLVMRPRDMAKFGYLYLKGGVWDGKQIVDSKWVIDSTEPHIAINWGGKIANHYGYQWYIHPYGFHSMGYFGQFIFVLPGVNMVVVFTSEMAKHELEIPIKLVEEYLVTAPKSAGPLPDNKQDYALLKEQVGIFNNRTP